MIKKYSVDHIGLWTQDAFKLIKFYKDKLGFKVISSQRLTKEIVKKIFGLNTACCFYRLQSEGLKLEIFEPHRKFRTKKHKIFSGIHHFGLVVEDRETFIKNARKQKIKIIKIRRNSHIVYFIKDPDGNMIEIREKG